MTTRARLARKVKSLIKQHQQSGRGFDSEMASLNAVRHLVKTGPTRRRKGADGEVRELIRTTAIYLADLTERPKDFSAFRAAVSKQCAVHMVVLSEVLR